MQSACSRATEGCRIRAWAGLWPGSATISPAGTNGPRHNCGVLRRTTLCFSTVGVGGDGTTNALQPVQSQRPATHPPPCMKRLPQTCRTGPCSGRLPCLPPSRGLALDLGSAIPLQDCHSDSEPVASSVSNSRVKRGRHQGILQPGVTGVRRWHTKRRRFRRAQAAKHRQKSSWLFDQEAVSDRYTSVGWMQRT